MRYAAPALLFAALAAASPTRAEGQDAPCARGVVSRVEIQNNSLFAPRDVEGRRFAWAMGLVNFVHIRTREGFLRREMLLDEGDCFDPGLLADSERRIRDLDFVARIQTRAEPAPDSTWVIHVETWDEWTTQMSIDFDVENQFQWKGFFVTEKNLLGTGLRLTYRYRDFREERNRYLVLSTPTLLGSRTYASISGGTTRTGNLRATEVRHPFIGEEGRFYLDAALRTEDREFAWFTGQSDDVSHVLLPLRERSARGQMSRRWGRPGALVSLGGEIDLLRRDVVAAPRMVPRGDFERVATAPDSLAARLVGQDSPDSYLRLGVSLGIRRVRFTTAQGLELVSGVQNVTLGADLGITVGRTVETFGSDGLDTWAQAHAALSGWTGPLLTVGSFKAEARRMDAPAPGTPRWRDMHIQGDLTSFFQPGGSVHNTLLAKVRLELGANVEQPWQSTLGGEFGLHGYNEQGVPAGSLLVGRLEHRVDLGWIEPVADLGLVTFADIGRGWASGVPFATDTGWRESVGIGLHVGAPAGTGSISRIEIAWPVNDPLGRGPVFRTYWSPISTSF